VSMASHVKGGSARRVGAADVPRRSQRRWLRRLALAAVPVILLAGAIYGWAWLSTDSSTVARALVWMEADVGDQRRFPARRIPAGEHASRLPVGGEAELLAPDLDGDGRATVLDVLVRETDTRAFAVAHEDRLVYEHYLGGSDRRALETSFSVAKSFVSTLVGIAIEEGLIGGIDDPVTDYLPELAERDPRFERITLRHLLTMSSGLGYTESDFPWPRSDDTYTYYGVDLRQVALERSEVEGPPGQEWRYNNYNPLLLGLVLERATGMSVSRYMAARLWQPLGAGSDATWSLDSQRSGFEKMESGLNATTVDYVRFGLLYLHAGRLQGERVISENWIRAATAAHTSTDHDNPYGYFWWVDAERPGNFYAFGNFGQYIYVASDADAVIVRTGSDWGVDNERWLEIFRDITDQLTDPTRSGAPASG
jgi:CubicO group peptidase (beta-lactamase class C family)